MTDWTPNTEQVRDAYVRAMRNAFIASASEHREEFDRWLGLERLKARQHGYAERLADEAAGIGADIDEWASPLHHTLESLRAEYASYQQTRDLHELARAVGQILNGPDDVQPESEWKTVERPGEEDEPHE